MKLLECSRDDLLHPLQTVSGIVERRHTLPILSNVLIERGDNGLNVLATDLEIQICSPLQSLQLVFEPISEFRLYRRRGRSIPARSVQLFWITVTWSTSRSADTMANLTFAPSCIRAWKMTFDVLSCVAFRTRSLSLKPAAA